MISKLNTDHQQIQGIIFNISSKSKTYLQELSWKPSEVVQKLPEEEEETV